MEKLLYKGRPSLFSFFQFYFPSLFILIVSLYLIIERDVINGLINIPFIGSSSFFSFYIFFSFIIIVPSLGFAIYKLNLKYFLFPLLGLVISIFIKHYYLKIPFKIAQDTTWLIKNFEAIVFMIYSSISLIHTELYRRSHVYEVTDKFIKTSAGIISHKERILTLNKINDIAINQSGFGKLFNYGSIIPLTASGIGMGFNFAAVSGSETMKLFKTPYITLTVTGGHAIQIPKSRTYEALIGIKNYRKVLHDITNYIKE